MMKILTVLFIVSFVTILQIVAGTENVDREKMEWPIDAKNFHTLEYFFDPSTSKVIIHVWDGNSSVVYSGIRVKVCEGKAVSQYRFTILSKIGGGNARNDPIFERTEGNGWMVSFSAPGFNPRQDQIIYQGDEHDDTRPIPYKGGATEARAEMNARANQ